MADRVHPSAKTNGTATAAADRVHPSAKTNGTATAAADRVYPSTKSNATATAAADRVHPSTKTNATATATATASGAVGIPPIPKPPSAQAKLYNPTRHPYRPKPAASHRGRKDRHFSCRRCFCLTCLWFTLILMVILLLASITAVAFYVLFQPHNSSFSVTSLKISSFNLTTTPADETTHLTTKFNLTLSVRNPNKKITFFYQPISIAVLSNTVKLSHTPYTKFTNFPDTIFILHTTIGPNSQLLETDSVNSLKSDLKRKNGLPLTIVMDTVLGIKMNNLKMKKIGLRVKCDGIHGVVPKGKNANPVVANTSKAKCKVDLRIKIFKWTF